MRATIIPGIFGFSYQLSSVLRTTSSTYTRTGKVATATNANGAVTRYAYDLLDRLVRTTDAVGRITKFAYDAVSRPTGTFNKAIQSGALLTQSWTADGLRASLADGNGNTTAFAYDGFNRLATTTYPSVGGVSRTETLTYDSDSNVTKRCTRAGLPIGFGYDTLNRLSTRTLPGSAANCAATPVGNESKICGRCHRSRHWRIRRRDRRRTFGHGCRPARWPVVILVRPRRRSRRTNIWSDRRLRAAFRSTVSVMRLTQAQLGSFSRTRIPLGNCFSRDRVNAVEVNRT